MREAITISTDKREQLIDITTQVNAVVQRSGANNGLVSVYAQGATAAVMVQENWDFHAGRIFSCASSTGRGRKER